MNIFNKHIFIFIEPILIEEPSIKDIKNTPPVPTAVGKKCNNIKDMFMKITKKNKGPDTIYDIKLKETLLEMGINHNDDTNIDTICQKYKIENELLNLLVELKIDSSKYIINEKSRFEPIDIFSVEIKDKNVRLSDLHINKIDNMTDSIDQFMNLDFNDSSKICEIQKSKSEITTENSAIKSLEKYDHLSPKSQIPNISEDKLEDVNKELILENKSCSPERIEEKGLDFFGLDSLDDLFEESSLSNQPSTSPILCSQRPKIYSNCSKVEKSNNSSISNVQNITKTNKNDSSFLTVTQIINMIDENYEIPSNEMLKSPTYKQVDEDEIEIQKSPILTQNVSTKRKYEKLSIPSTSFVVLETSESSQSEDEQMKINNNEKCNDKIILEESCDLFSNYKEDVSPFFKSNTEPKSPSIIGQRSLSLKEKLHKSLKTKTIDNTSQKITESNSNKNDRNTFLSQFAAVEKSKINSDCNPNSKNANNPFESDDDFENILKLLPSPKKSPNIKHTPRKHLQYKKKKVRKKKCDFIEYEAELSSDSYDSSDDENHDSSNSQIIDTSLVEFICDEEIPVCNENIDMQAKYLQSVK